MVIVRRKRSINCGRSVEENGDGEGKEHTFALF